MHKFQSFSKRLAVLFFSCCGNNRETTLGIWRYWLWLMIPVFTLGLACNTNETPVPLSADTGAELKDYSSIKEILRWNPKPEILKEFIAQGKTDEINDPLLIYYAAEWCSSPECVQILIDNGCDPDVGTTITPLHKAATRNPNPGIIRCLVRNGAKINPFKDIELTNGRMMPNSPLHRAARSNPNIEVSKCLIELGADPDQKNNDGLTPFDYAFMYNKNPEIVGYYADLFVKTDPDGPGYIVPLCIAAKHSKTSEVVSFLAEKVPEINTYWAGSTSLHYALHNSNTEDRRPIVEVLMAAGANPKLKNTYDADAYDFIDEYNLAGYAEIFEKYE